MMNCYPHLFSPLKVKNVILKNRIVATPVGDPIEAARGGAGLVIDHSVPVDLPNAYWGKVPHPFSKYELENTKKRINSARQYGAKFSVEILHCGNQAKVGPGETAWGPCDMVNDDGCQVTAMTPEQMELVVEAYGKTAREAVKVGYDMIFIHFAHGWLPAQFISPLYNHRTDEYGGSLENRAKFPLRILKRIREAVGPDYPLDMRISAVEHVPGSITFADTLAFIQMAEPYIDMVHISCGLDKGFQYGGNTRAMTTIFEPHQINVAYAAEVKKHVRIPVTVVGAIGSPEAAEEIIASGKADLVGIGRPFVADPNWANKAKEGRGKEITPCLRCLYCYHIATDHWNKGCSVNPAYANEGEVTAEWNITPAAKPKKVMVVGAGPAGIRAALAAEQRGHQVTLVEKEKEIGGQLRWIAREYFKEEVKRYLEYLTNRIERSRVEVLLNTEADPALIRERRPDHLIIAIGAEENRLKIPGTDRRHVMTALEAIENHGKLGRKVVIIGGGVNGAELGLGLAFKEQKEVTIVEMTDQIAASANRLFRISYNQQLEKCPNLTIIKEAKSKEITEKEVVIEKEGKEERIPYDDVIISVGLHAKTEEAYAMFGITPDTVCVGDCVKPRIMKDATFEGYTAGVNI